MRNLVHPGADGSPRLLITALSDLLPVGAPRMLHEDSPGLRNERLSPLEGHVPESSSEGAAILVNRLVRSLQVRYEGTAEGPPTGRSCHGPEIH